jgi:hypothetical protein
LAGNGEINVRNVGFYESEPELENHRWLGAARPGVPHIDFTITGRFLDFAIRLLPPG